MPTAIPNHRVCIIKNINDVFNNETFDIKYFCVNKTEQLSVDDDLNDIYLNRKPRKHTIIILKEKVRCSYTINKEYVGILYERKASYDFNEMTIILFGKAQLLFFWPKYLRPHPRSLVQNRRRCMCF